jgi:hypothetical protein
LDEYTSLVGIVVSPGAGSHVICCAGGSETNPSLAASGEINSRIIQPAPTANPTRSIDKERIIVVTLDLLFQPGVVSLDATLFVEV